MQIPDEIRKCVCFVGYRTAKEHRLAGTAFLVGVKLGVFDRYAVYSITCRHVIEEAGKRSIDGKIQLRLNFVGQEAQYVETELSSWIFHPNHKVDVAVHAIALNDNMDCRFYPTDSFATDTVIQERAIGIGDELFLSGLFVHHAGRMSNVPIIRVGNIAAMPGEPVCTKSWGDMNAYLVECRSIGGLSGSPVFVYLGSIRSIAGNASLLGGQPSFYLLGMMHGHWDQPNSDVDVQADFSSGEKLNTGIAVVVPCGDILDVLIQPEQIQYRQALVEFYKIENSPTIDTPSLPGKSDQTLVVMPEHWLES